MLMVLSRYLRQVGKMIERRIVSSLSLQVRAARTLIDDLTGELVRCQAQGREFIKSNMPAWLLDFQARCERTGGLAGQAGFSIIGLLIGAGIVIVIAVFFVMQGLPVLVSQTSNTTAMTSAGMDDTQIRWWKWGLWAVIMIVISSVAIVLIKQYSDGMYGGGGRGGSHRRRRR